MKETQLIALCLHGWGSRPQVFEVQLRTLVKPLRDLGFKVVFAQAPCSLWMGKLDVVRTFGGPYFGWYQKETKETIARAIAFVHDQQDLTEVSAIVGFSQGATLGLIIASLLEHDELKSWLPGVTVEYPESQPMDLAPVDSPRWTPDGEFEVNMSARPDLGAMQSSWTASTVSSSAMTTRSSSLADVFSWSAGDSTADSLGTSSSSSEAALPKFHSSKHKLRFVVALCPINTAWSPSNTDLAGCGFEDGENEWLPTIPTFMSIGEMDRYKSHSVKMAARVGRNSSKHRVATFAFGHEVPRSVEATGSLVEFVKTYSPPPAILKKTTTFPDLTAYYE